MIERALEIQCGGADEIVILDYFVQRSLLYLLSPTLAIQNWPPSRIPSSSVVPVQKIENKIKYISLISFFLLLSLPETHSKRQATLHKWDK
jgi:hypothetical protein